MSATYQNKTLGEYLDENGYSEAFRRNYLLPMCAAVWSVPNKQVGCWAVEVLGGQAQRSHALWSCYEGC